MEPASLGLLFNKLVEVSNVRWLARHHCLSLTHREPISRPSFSTTNATEVEIGICSSEEILRVFARVLLGCRVVLVEQIGNSHSTAIRAFDECSIKGIDLCTAHRTLTPFYTTFIGSGSIHIELRLLAREGLTLASHRLKCLMVPLIVFKALETHHTARL